MPPDQPVAATILPLLGGPLDGGTVALPPTVERVTYGLLRETYQLDAELTLPFWARVTPQHHKALGVATYERQVEAMVHTGTKMR